MRALRTLAVVSAMILAAMVLMAAPALAGWEKELTRQMREDAACDVTFITQVVERDTADGRFIQAHVACTDNRHFLLHRTGNLTRFILEPHVKGGGHS